MPTDFRNVEFLNLEPSDINPRMCKTDIKVLYLGKNPNRTLMNEEFIQKVAKTLRGIPIVGKFNEDKNDFEDHNKLLSLDVEKGEFSTISDTRPYGFIPTDALVWLQDFREYDPLLKDYTTHTWLLTQGYLWNGRYPELNTIFENNKKGQSLEFVDDESYQGDWHFFEEFNKKFFIINDAIFDALCLLGDDVPPAFMGASFTPVEELEKIVDYSTSRPKYKDLLGEEFEGQMLDMMQQITYTLKGGQPDMDEQIKDTVEQPVEEEKKEEAQTEAVEQPVEEAKKEEENLDKKEENNNSETENNTEGEKAEEAEEQAAEEPEVASESEPQAEQEAAPAEFSVLLTQYTELKSQYDNLTAQYEALKAEHEGLVQYKANIEAKEKDKMIQSFYMLSDEDKADVIEHKMDYSLDEIEAKLSVIGRRKGVNFSLSEDEKEEAPLTTYSLQSSSNVKAAKEEVPDWAQAVLDNMEE